jgi:hypothetical protein
VLSARTTKKDGSHSDHVVLAQRVSYAQFPQPQQGVRFLASRRFEAHAKLSDELIVASIRRSRPWQEVMVPVLQQWGERRCRTKDGSRLKPGPAPRYSPEELETMELFRRVMGAETYRAACERMSSFRARRARKMLGFDEPRHVVRHGEELTHPGVPSEAVMSKYRREIGNEAREALWGSFLARLRSDYASMSADQSSRILYGDGTHIRIAGTCPIYDRKTGELVNEPRVSVWDGGFVPVYNGGRKGGHGFNLMTLVDDRGVPLSHTVEKINTGEPEMAEAVIADWASNVRPHSPTDVVRVFSGDGALSSPHVRIACRQAGIIENLHAVSHGDQPKSKKRATQFDRMRYAIHGTADWKLNGHRELVSVCGCGTPTQARQAWLDRKGRAHTRIKATCSTCGSTISLSSGKKRRAKNPDRIVEKSYLDDPAKVDWAAGNPLTFNDPMAAAYGTSRWTRDEGFHGALSSKYKLNKAGRRFRSRKQVELETNIVYSVLLSLAIWGREYEAGADATAARFAA